MSQVVDEFEWFAEWAAGVTPLYERLAKGVVEDTQLLDIAAESAPSQPAPNLLFGAVHALLLGGIEHELAAFYPTCTDSALAVDQHDPFPAFRDLCLEYEDRIRELVASRRVQTNEVGRAAVLFPAFKSLAGMTERPLAVVEIGTSAGLNLYWDQFRYAYDDTGTYGMVDSPVTIDSALRGETEPPLENRTPTVDRRIGIDINTLDVTDPADARWLRALVIPDQDRRFDRLDAAIDLAKTQQPRLVDGNALDVLPEILSEIPDRFEIVVFSTLVLYQLTDSEIETLRGLLDEQSHRRSRPIHWLSNDPSHDGTPPVYRHVAFGTDQQHRRLAAYKAHGEWVEWIADSNP